MFNNTLDTVALVAVAGGEAVADGGGGQQAGEEDVRIREGLRLGGGVEDVVGVLLDGQGVVLHGQGIAKSRNGEEHVVEALHHDC